MSDFKIPYAPKPITSALPGRSKFTPSFALTEEKKKKIVPKLPTIPSLEEQRLQRDIRATGVSEPEIIASGQRIMAEQQQRETADKLRAMGRPVPAPPVNLANITPTGKGASFQLGVGKAFLPETSTTPEALKQGGLISQISQARVERDPSKVAEMGGRLFGTAIQYATIANQIAPLTARLGLTGAKQFAATQGADLLVDNIVQLPKEIIDSINNDQSIGEDAKRIAKRNLVDMAFNLAIGGAGEMFKKILQSNDAAVRQAAQEALANAPESVRKLIEVEPVSLRQLGEEVPQVGPLRGLEPQTGPLREVAEQQARQITPQLPTRSIAEEVGIPRVDSNIEREVLEIEIQPVIKENAQGAPVALGDVKERGFARNVRTDEAMEQQVRESFEQVQETYNQLGNKTVLESAQARFDKGYEQALQDFNASKNQIRADNVPLARLIANEAAKRGDMATARTVISDIAETLTTAGQFSQASKILRESNDPATVLQFVLKEMNRLNSQGVKRYGELRKGFAGLGERGWKPIELTDDELKLINQINKDTSDEQKQQVFEQLFNSVQSRIPVTFREKFDAWRRISMLFNPKTHVRNIVGNTIMGGVKRVSDAVEAGAQTLIPQAQRTRSFAVNKELQNVADQYWNTNKKQLSEGSRWEIFGVQSPFADRRIFDTDFLESLNQLSKKTLENEDLFFLERHFKRDLGSYMQARGIKEPTQDAVDYALRRAQEATFRQQNGLADAINRLKGTRGGLIVEAAVPFTKTPANILSTGLDYSPVGVAKAVTQLLNSAEPSVFIETMSKGMTGTGLAYLGFHLANQGLVRGNYKKDKEEESVEQLAGRLPNSITLPNGSYTIDWAQPSSMPFFAGVAFAETLAQEKGDDPNYLEAVGNSLVAGGDSLIEASMLRGIKDLFGGYGSTTEKIAELPLSYVGQAVPTLAGQITRSIDPVKRERDYSSLIPKVQTQTIAKLPLASQQLPPKRGLLGEELTYGQGALNIVQQFLSPGYVGTVSQDPVAQEIVRLYDSVGSNFLPRARVKNVTYNKQKYTFTPQEISDFQRVMGEETRRLIASYLDNPVYKNSTDKEKADIIKDINDSAYDKAKEQFLINKGVIQ